MSRTNTIKGWLLPAALILFLSGMILLPFAIQLTYAGRSESPDHLLTYTASKLTWDSATGVDPDTGVAELSLFNSTYQNVLAENGEKVVAPGTEGTNIVRLKNDGDSPIRYIAVMYRMKDESTLPVEPVMADDEAFTDAETYPLPQGVDQTQVVRAVTGTVAANELQDFDITWLWNYYENENRDQLDTALGNRAAWEIPDDVQAGLYIVVAEDSNSDTSYTRPQVPQTGDSSSPGLYLMLMAVSGALLFLSIIDRRKEKKCKGS